MSILIAAISESQKNPQHLSMCVHLKTSFSLLLKIPYEESILAHMTETLIATYQVKLVCYSSRLHCRNIHESQTPCCSIKASGLPLSSAAKLPRGRISASSPFKIGRFRRGQTLQYGNCCLEKTV